MSVQSEINRIKLNISNALDAVAAYGVQTEETDGSDELATRIALISSALEGFVKYTLQTLTDILKLQARENINAASSSDIPTIPTNISAFNNDVGYLTQHLDISGKLDKIDDLSTIRSGAALGASALLSLPSNAVTTDTDLTIDSNKVFSKSISGSKNIIWNLLIPELNKLYTNDRIDTREFILLSVSNISSLLYIYNPILLLLIFTATTNELSITISGKKINFIILLSIPLVVSHTYIVNLDFVETNPLVVGGIKVQNILLFDLTQMFGNGNEPSTVEEFKSMFPLDYYEYNAGSTLEKALLVGSNLNAPILYEGGLKLSDKYNVNLGCKTLEELKDALKAIW